MTEQTSHCALEAIPRHRWQQLCADRDPFLDHRYLETLEATGCVGGNSGWQPCHLSLGAEQTRAVMPLYLKQDSYGEYVFDWSWARAAAASGIPYYPKLVTAIPFTPVEGPRFGCQAPADLVDLLAAVRHQALTQEASSWHLLFANPTDIEQLKQFAAAGMPLLERHGCQFRWQNRDYQDFDDYLSRFVSRKRKGIRRERRRVAEQGVSLTRLSGNEIDQQTLADFYGFYRSTYHQRGQQPYLNPAFFQRLIERMPEQLMLVRAGIDDRTVGAALFLCGRDTLYGRWWGGDPGIDCLHFEACYYQGIEYAIERKLQYFDPGTQGEHKLLRGFEPVITRSLHWIRNPALAAAVERWLDQERLHIAAYRNEALNYLPFKKAT